MRKRTVKFIAVFAAFCVAFSGLPFMAGNLDAHAAAKTLPKKITLKATASGQTAASLSWNKIKSPQKGYAVFRNGKPIKHLNTKKIKFSDTGLKAGTTYQYQIKTYKTKKVTQWYNKQTKKWQTKKPAKKYRGKSKKVTAYTYKTKSNLVTIKTAAAPTYTITWKNWDGSVLGTVKVKQGTKPSYSGTPTRAADEENTYTFSGWSPAVSAASGNVTYTAQYKATPIPDTYYTVTWKDWDGTVLQTEQVKKGVTPAYSGTPTRASDSDNTYVFNGWTPSITAATKDATYTAEYDAKAIKKYQIIWKNYDGEVLKTESLRAGQMPSFTDTPEKPEDDEYTYEFSGWTPRVTSVTGAATYLATFDAIPKNSEEEPSTYKITWKNEDGTVLLSERLEEGVMPSYEGTLTKEEDDTYTYEFAGWTPSVTAVTGDQVYTAKFTPIRKPVYYTVTWKNWNGTVLKTEPVEEGKTPSYSGTPTRAADANATYSFSGWSPKVAPATANVTYTAQYTSKSKSSQYSYEIKFINEPYGNGGESVIFLQTNNPNWWSYSWGIYDKNDKVVKCEYVATDSFDDVASNYKSYISVVRPESAGRSTFKFFEIDDNGNEKVVFSKTVNLRDYAAEEKVWRKSIIDNVTTADMSKKEKLGAVAQYLIDNFKYLKWDGTRYINLIADEGIPYWKTERIDSAISPAVLVDFGNDLGYPVENLYGKYERGTEEWKRYHMRVYSAADDTYFSACPDSSTGLMSRSDIVMFDPDNYEFWGE